jgi:two-component system cell cycle response regulator
MPIMDGMEMLGMLRASHELRGIPVVMLTAEAGRETVLKIAKMGVRDYLIKPFKEEQIIERVSRIVPLEAVSVGDKVRKRFDDPIKLLLVDDKTAILDQLKQGLADTCWQIDGATDAHSGLLSIESRIPDVVLISTSLPDNTGFWLVQKLRASMKTQRLPIFALMVKTASIDQTRAQQLGFTAIVTKPIDYVDLKTRVARSLKLDASYRYYKQREGIMYLELPEAVTPFDFNEITNNLERRTSEAVDAGLDKLVIDIRRLQKVDMAVIEMCLNVVKFATDLSMRVDFLGTPELEDACGQFQETKSWHFFLSEEELAKAFNKAPPTA